MWLFNLLVHDGPWAIANFAICPHVAVVTFVNNTGVTMHCILDASISFPPPPLPLRSQGELSPVQVCRNATGDENGCAPLTRLISASSKAFSAAISVSEAEQLGTPTPPTAAGWYLKRLGTASEPLWRSKNSRPSLLFKQILFQSARQFMSDSSEKLLPCMSGVDRGRPEGHISKSLIKSTRLKSGSLKLVD